MIDAAPETSRRARLKKFIGQDQRSNGGARIATACGYCLIDGNLKLLGFCL